MRFIEPYNVSDAGGLSEHPSIVAGSGGGVYVAWDDDKTGEKDVFFSKTTDFGATYLPTASTINISNTGTASFPSIGLGKDVNQAIHIVWQDISKGQSEILYSRSTDQGGTFSSPVQLSAINAVGDANTQEIKPFIAVDTRTSGTGAGNVYVAWSQQGLDSSVKLARSTDGGANFTEVQVSVPTGHLTDLNTMAIDGAGVVHMSWIEDDGSNSATRRAIRYAQSADAGLSITTPVSLALGEVLAFPTIAAGTDGAGTHVYAAWRNETDRKIHFSASDDGGSTFHISDVVIVDNLSASPKIHSINPRLTVGPDSTIYLAWTDNKGGDYDTYFSQSLDHGATFLPPLNIADSAQGSLFTAIAVDDQSNVYIAWDDNRYPNPENVSSELAGEANFEILVSRGKLGVPAVLSAAASPCPVTPNGDGKADTSTFAATFSEALNWVLSIFTADGTQVYQATGGLETALSSTWDGTANIGVSSGSVLTDGTYTYKISGHNASGLASTQATASIVLYTATGDVKPKILSFATEAFGFSPNDDGFKDNDGFSAQFNTPVNWTIAISDKTTNTVKKTLTGSGTSIDPDVTRWDGTDGGNSPGNLLPEGEYLAKLSIIDGTGQTDACGQAPAVVCHTMEIDSTKPNISNASLSTGSCTYDMGPDPVPPEDLPSECSYSPSGGSLTMSGIPSEYALVTIYIYNQAGVLISKLPNSSLPEEQRGRAFHDSGVAFSVPWDGKDSSGSTATPGSYKVYMWARDRAGNTAETYPRKMPFTIP